MNRQTIATREPLRIAPDIVSAGGSRTREVERPEPEMERVAARPRASPVPERDLRARMTACDVPLGRPMPARKVVTRWGRYRLTPDSVGALRMIGVFRGASCDDLAGLFQSRNRSRQALDALEGYGLVVIERFRRGSAKLRTASLTTRGKRFLHRCIDPRDPGDAEAQMYRSGKASSHHVLHDAAVYRAAQRQIDGLEAQGRRVIRIRTGDDLQDLANRRLDQARRSGQDELESRAAIRSDLDLAEHGGRFVIPDARIEYRDEGISGRASGSGSIDIEVITSKYSSESIRLKTEAGFQIYRMQADGSLAGEGTAREEGPAR